LHLLYNAHLVANILEKAFYFSSNLGSDLIDKNLVDAGDRTAAQK